MCHCFCFLCSGILYTVCWTSVIAEIVQNGQFESTVLVDVIEQTWVTYGYSTLSQEQSHEKLEGAKSNLSQGAEASELIRSISGLSAKIRRFGYDWHMTDIPWRWCESDKWFTKTPSLDCPLCSVSPFHCFVCRLDCLLAGCYTTDINGTGKRWGQCQRRPSPQAPLHRQSQKTAKTAFHASCWAMCFSFKLNFKLNPLFWQERSTFTGQIYFQGFPNKKLSPLKKPEPKHQRCFCENIQ